MFRRVFGRACGATSARCRSSCARPPASARHWHTGSRQQATGATHTSELADREWGRAVVEVSHCCACCTRAASWRIQQGSLRAEASQDIRPMKEWSQQRASWQRGGGVGPPYSIVCMRTAARPPALYGCPQWSVAGPVFARSFAASAMVAVTTDLQLGSPLGIFSVSSSAAATAT